jgi:hypothetical protein
MQIGVPLWSHTYANWSASLEPHLCKWECLSGATTREVETFFRSLGFILLLENVESNTSDGTKVTLWQALIMATIGKKEITSVVPLTGILKLSASTFESMLSSTVDSYRISREPNHKRAPQNVPSAAPVAAPVEAKLRVCFLCTTCRYRLQKRWRRR